MLYGIRPDEQLRLAAAGTRVRAYVPYGIDWYGYFMRRWPSARPTSASSSARSSPSPDPSDSPTTEGSTPWTPSPRSPPRNEPVLNYAPARRSARPWRPGWPSWPDRAWS